MYNPSCVIVKVLQYGNAENFISDDDSDFEDVPEYIPPEATVPEFFNKNSESSENPWRPQAKEPQFNPAADLEIAGPSCSSAESEITTGNEERSVTEKIYEECHVSLF